MGAALAALFPLLAVAAGCSPDDGGSATGPALTVAGYVAPWDRRGDPALDRPPSPLRELSPVWYQPSDSGEVVFPNDQARADADGAAARLRARGVRLLPSVSNFRGGTWDGALVSDILSDEDRRRRHIDALVAIGRQSGVAGVDIDYESLDPELRHEYSAFIGDLARALHRVDRTLSVTVQAKTGEPGTTPGAQAQDWRRLGAVADEVRIMAYDHAWQGSPPGPVAPLPWVEDVLRFAVERIPPPKIFLGLAAYGYDWPDGGDGRNVAWADAAAIAESRGVAERWDEETSSPWLRYTDDEGRRHTVWYENARSLRTKLDLLRRHPIGGVVVWKLGGEDPAIWRVLGDVA